MLPGWSVCQIESGTGYWMHSRHNREIDTGTVLLISAEVNGNIRASGVGEGMSLVVFKVEPSRLTGLITMTEQLFFETTASIRTGPLKVFAPQSQVALRMKALCANREVSGCVIRLQLLQTFFEFFGNELKPETFTSEGARDAKERLREYLRQAPESELLDISTAELAQMTGCTRRHLSRIFQEVVGVSFRDKHNELRLSRARELLANTKSKIVDVALESGYQSLSLFNLMFTRRFGMSPGRWRHTVGSGKVSSPRNRRKDLLLEVR